MDQRKKLIGLQNRTSLGSLPLGQRLETSPTARRECSARATLMGDGAKPLLKASEALILSWAKHATSEGQDTCLNRNNDYVGVGAPWAI